MKIVGYFFATLLGIVHIAYGQNRFPPAGAVSIGTPQAHHSSLLEIKSLHKGILIPRMSDMQRKSIHEPANGLLVFQTNGQEGLYYYFNSGWKPVAAQSGANRHLSNLLAKTQVNINLTPDQKGVRDLGEEQFEWRNLHMEGDIFIANAGRFLSHSNGANVFLGFGAGANNTDGSANVALGNHTLTQNVFGNLNTAVGWQALHNNVSGSHNTAVGVNALTSNNADGNTAVGIDALSLNQSGIVNVAVREATLWNNITGSFNIGMGYLALYNNTEGVYNLGLGVSALGRNRSGNGNTSVGNLSLLDAMSDNNTAVGYLAGYFNQAPQECTFLGSSADANDFVSNSVAIGFKARALESNQVMVGNTSITSIGGFANWTNFSDGRFKQNIKEEVPGIEFINKLRPVTYTINIEGVNRVINSARTKSDKGVRDLKKGNNNVKLINAEISENERTSVTEKTKTLYTGFIAQEVQEAAKQINYNFSGVDAPKDENGFYGLRYGDFVVPLVKAVQELDSANKAKDERISKLEEEMLELRQIIRENDGNRFTPGKAWMKQNTPNPASVNTTIQYSIPDDARSARIIVTNELGQQVKVFNVSGAGSIYFNTGTLPSGTYNYSLIADNKTLITKKLVIAR